MDKVIITVAMTGSQPTRAMNPGLPITPQEIADSAYECLNEGAAIVHVHVRDPKTGARSMAHELYEEVVERVRVKSRMIINLTTGPRGRSSRARITDRIPRPRSSSRRRSASRMSSSRSRRCARSMSAAPTSAPWCS